MENLYKYESVNKTTGTRYTDLQFEKIGNIGHVLVSYPNGQTARTRYDENTRNLYILSPIQVVESMYLDTFYILD